MPELMSGEVDDMDRLRGHRFPRLAARPAVAALAAMLLFSMSAMLVPGTADSFGPQPPPPPPPPATLTIQAPATSTIGQSVGVVATLQTGQGQPLGGQPVTLFVNAAPLATVASDSQGHAAFTIPGSSLSSAGAYILKAIGRGGGGFRNPFVSATATLTVVAAAVATTPPAPPTPRKTPPIPVNTALSISVPTGSQLGQDVPVTASIKDASGRPLAGQHLALMLDGSQLDSNLSDPGGQVAFSISGKKIKQAGAYAVQATFSGSQGYSSSATQETLTVGPAAVQIGTVPAFPGIEFTLDGVTGVTGADGVATLEIPASGTYKLTSNLNADGTATTTRAGFLNWADGDTTADRSITVDGPATYTMGLRVASAARIDYVDMTGRPVDPSLVSEAHFRAGDGTEVALNPQTGAREIWWTSSTTAAQGSGLSAKPVSYSAESVRIHGAEVLAADQPAWTPSVGDTWTVRLRVYDLSIRAQDVLFGAPISGQAHLAMPDKSSIGATVGPDGAAHFSAVPAGQYLVRFDSSELSQSASVTVSVPESQVQTLRGFTIRDAAIAFGLPLAIIVLLTVAAVWWRLKKRPRLAA